eukprot:gnl/Chilomastix_cuspidata/2057.p1 GENE.gnl/Chilomastix_cuspidata/2057~~gnl/Chilomastix_cuspidata/2057.p1  ORF type:complete len:2165 (-),score=938.62 gnl/Chilomastix_cuspidata/2057:320-6733(-)
MGEEEEIPSQLSKRLVYSKWNVRMDAYSELADVLKTRAPSDPLFEKFAPQLPKFVQDPHAACTAKAVALAEVYAPHALRPKVLKPVLGGIIDKGLGSPRAPTRAGAEEALLMYIAYGKGEPVCRALHAALKTKAPKHLIAVLAAYASAVTQFGVQGTGVDVQPILAAIPTVMGNKNISVRKSVVKLIGAVAHATNPDFTRKVLAAKLDPPQLKEVDAELARVANLGAFAPSRALANPADLELDAPAAPAAAEAGDAPEAEAAPPAFDAFAMIPAEPLKVPAKFFERLEDKKWTERRGALEELISGAEGASKLDPASFDAPGFYKALNKVVLKDINVNVVALALGAASVLATRLDHTSDAFAACSSAARRLLPGFLFRFKERKPNVIAAAHLAADSLFLRCSRLDEVFEPVAETILSHRNPKVREEGLKMCYRLLTAGARADAPEVLGFPARKTLGRPAPADAEDEDAPSADEVQQRTDIMRNAAPTPAEVVRFFETFLKASDDSNEACRTIALQCLAVLVSHVGEAKTRRLVAPLEGVKLGRFEEFFRKEEERLGNLLGARKPPTAGKKAPARPGRPPAAKASDAKRAGPHTPGRTSRSAEHQSPVSEVSPGGSMRRALPPPNLSKRQGLSSPGPKPSSSRPSSKQEPKPPRPQEKPHVTTPSRTRRDPRQRTRPSQAKPSTPAPEPGKSVKLPNYAAALKEFHKSCEAAAAHSPLGDAPVPDALAAHAFFGPLLKMLPDAGGPWPGAEQFSAALRVFCDFLDASEVSPCPPWDSETPLGALKAGIAPPPLPDMVLHKESGPAEERQQTIGAHHGPFSQPPPAAPSPEWSQGVAEMLAFAAHVLEQGVGELASEAAVQFADRAVRFASQGHMIFPEPVGARARAAASARVGPRSDLCPPVGELQKFVLAAARTGQLSGSAQALAGAFVGSSFFAHLALRELAAEQSEASAHAAELLIQGCARALTGHGVIERAGFSFEATCVLCLKARSSAHDGVRTAGQLLVDALVRCLGPSVCRVATFLFSDVAGTDRALEVAPSRAALPPIADYIPVSHPLGERAVTGLPFPLCRPVVTLSDPSALIRMFLPPADPAQLLPPLDKAKLSLTAPKWQDRASAIEEYTETLNRSCFNTLPTPFYQDFARLVSDRINMETNANIVSRLYHLAHATISALGSASSVLVPAFAKAATTALGSSKAANVATARKCLTALLPYSTPVFLMFPPRPELLHADAPGQAAILHVPVVTANPLAKHFATTVQTEQAQTVRVGALQWIEGTLSQVPTLPVPLAHETIKELFPLLKITLKKAVEGSQAQRKAAQRVATELTRLFKTMAPAENIFKRLGVTAQRSLAPLMEKLRELARAQKEEEGAAHPGPGNAAGPRAASARSATPSSMTRSASTEVLKQPQPASAGGHRRTTSLEATAPAAGQPAKPRRNPVTPGRGPKKPTTPSRTGKQARAVPASKPAAPPPAPPQEPRTPEFDAATISLPEGIPDAPFDQSAEELLRPTPDIAKRLKEAEALAAQSAPGSLLKTPHVSTKELDAFSDSIEDTVLEPYPVSTSQVRFTTTPDAHARRHSRGQSRNAPPAARMSGFLNELSKPAGLEGYETVDAPDGYSDRVERIITLFKRIIQLERKHAGTLDSSGLAAALLETTVRLMKTHTRLAQPLHARLLKYGAVVLALVLEDPRNALLLSAENILKALHVSITLMLDQGLRFCGTAGEETMALFNSLVASAAENCDTTVMVNALLAHLRGISSTLFALAMRELAPPSGYANASPLLALPPSLMPPSSPAPGDDAPGTRQSPAIIRTPLSLQEADVSMLSPSGFMYPLRFLAGNPEGHLRFARADAVWRDPVALTKVQVISARLLITAVKKAVASLAPEAAARRAAAAQLAEARALDGTPPLDWDPAVLAQIAEKQRAAAPPPLDAPARLDLDETLFNANLHLNSYHDGLVELKRLTNGLTVGPAHTAVQNPIAHAARGISVTASQMKYCSRTVKKVVSIFADALREDVCLFLSRVPRVGPGVLRAFVASKLRDIGAAADAGRCDAVEAATPAPVEFPREEIRNCIQRVTMQDTSETAIGELHALCLSLSGVARSGPAAELQAWLEGHLAPLLSEELGFSDLVVQFVVRAVVQRHVAPAD